jgi:hypothetical protein
MSLIEKGIKADYLGSSQTNPGVTKDAKNGKISLLYMTPEKALSLNQRSLFFYLSTYCIFLYPHCYAKHLHLFLSQLLDGSSIKRNLLSSS